MNFKHAFWTRLLSVALAVAVMFCVSGCTITDPEYSQKLAAARTDCTGKEIVGIWISKLSALGDTSRTTVLFRPDGTGRMRWKFQPRNSETYDQPLTWRYVGNGSWQSQVEKVPDMNGFDMDIRYTGDNLMVEQKCPTLVQQKVFVRANDQTVADEYANKKAPLK